MPSLGPDPLLGAAQDEEGLNAMFLEVGVALAPAARLHLVVPVQVVECGLGDMDASGEGREWQGGKRAGFQNPRYAEIHPLQSPGL